MSYNSNNTRGVLIKIVIGPRDREKYCPSPKGAGITLSYPNIQQYWSNISNNIQQYCSNIKTSHHKLEIEKLRHVRPIIPRRERKCTNCNFNETGNEYHHILICPKFATQRSSLIPKYYHQHPNFHKFPNIMSSKSKALQIKLTKYILSMSKWARYPREPHILKSLMFISIFLLYLSKLKDLCICEFIIS